MIMMKYQIFVVAVCYSLHLSTLTSGTYVEIPSSINQGQPPSQSPSNPRSNIAWPYHTYSQKIANDARLQQEALQSAFNGQQEQSTNTTLALRTIPKRPIAKEGPVMMETSLNPLPVGVISEPSCLYDRSYFSKIDECLSRKPFPIVGLTSFKNEDLLINKSLRDKSGCIFVLGNGLFKNHQVAKFSVESDSQCLDSSKVRLNLGFANVTQTYLWTLRCLNRADQLLDDSTLDGATSGHTIDEGICVGSSQSYGFTSIQMSNIEAQVELATDIYKNWRITNINDVFSNLSSVASRARASSGFNQSEGDRILPGSGIREFIFESLDGDELNWRYMNLFQNWTRNRLHGNFLDQYRRFLWIALQRCLSEDSRNLLVKPLEIFSDHKSF